MKIELSDKFSRTLITFFVVAISVISGMQIEKYRAPTLVSLALGYDQDKNVWNRIRVDSEGKVICVK